MKGLKDPEMRPTHTIQLTELLQFSNEVKSFKKGAYIFQEGMLAKNMYLILSGKVKVSKSTADGRELTLRLCSENDIVGEAVFFSHASDYLFSTEVVEDVEVAVISKERLEKEVLQDGALAYEFMKWIGDQYRKTQTKFRDLILYGKRGGVFSTLIRMTNSYGVQTPDGILIDLPLTDQKIGSFSATSRESVNRMLNELKRDGIISVKNGYITVHDLSYLRNEIDCDGCPITYCSID
ncbi:MAG TPA: Crp/Fnr family transcriptional regulator [Bacillota bacterium]|nr:Crp/Fnr family transcriptional regulator [Bacillota bacterium]